ASAFQFISMSVTIRFDKCFRIPVILLNNDPNNPRQTFIHARGLFFFKAFVEHFYQSLPRDGSLAAMRATTPDSGCSSWRESFAPAILRFYRHGLTPQAVPETLSLWPLRHPISLTVPA